MVNHVATGVRISCLLRLKKSPLDALLFIRPSVRGHVGSPPLTVVNNCYECGEQIPFGTLLSVLWGIYPEVGFLDQYNNLCFTFLVTSMSFPGAAGSFYVPNSAREPEALCALTSTVASVLIIAIPAGVRWGFHVALTNISND